MCFHLLVSYHFFPPDLSLLPQNLTTYDIVSVLVPTWSFYFTKLPVPPQLVNFYYFSSPKDQNPVSKSLERMEFGHLKLTFLFLLKPIEETSLFGFIYHLSISYTFFLPESWFEIGLSFSSFASHPQIHLLCEQVASLISCFTLKDLSLLSTLSASHTSWSILKYNHCQIIFSSNQQTQFHYYFAIQNITDVIIKCRHQIFSSSILLYSFQQC